MTSSPPGLDVSALTSWLDARRPGLRAGRLVAELIVGGKSNLTYRVTDGEHRWAVRRPPLAHLLPTAHDMAREFRVISALRHTEVPVPDAVALCTDANVLGAPFYVMSFVEGTVLDSAAAVASVGRGAATRVCTELVDTLVALHAVDPADVGLADFGRPEGFLERQLRRWHSQWQASATGPRPVLDRGVALLRAALPTSPPGAVVHGDYRLTNVILTPQLDGVAAVVDWEMATVGDPLADVGLLVVYHTLAAESALTMPVMRPADGFLSPARLVRRYAAASGRDLRELDWYVAFGFFKLAVVAEGIAARHRQGMTVGAGFERFGEAVPELLDRAADIMSRHHEPTR